MKRFFCMAFCALLLPGLFGCASNGSSNINSLAEAEINEYQGEKLGSIKDFRENSIKGPQKVDIKTYRLKVDGLVEKTASYTYAEVLANPKYSKVVTIHYVEGWDVTILWEGVLLKDIFDRSKARAQANTVIFHSVDGYTTSLPLKTILDKNMILAYKMNGVVLPPERGFPFQLVAEDKLGYKWAKWIDRIELSDNADYKGYWEQRGYDNDADFNN
ncbi:MAG TPA: molybdopterin-dependent oxidoreductase [Clostridiales bacterium]|nr:molybdopterin-dependent oxidoreductase [Clostridiales bacterium]HQK72208.1 molybdopterin-dependent oxidoreductase [Clostridiales bacterium]